MQVPDGLDPVGRWHYGYTPSKPAVKPHIDMAAAACRALSVLDQARLLAPDSLTCVLWLTGLGMRLKHAELPPLTLSMPAASWTPEGLTAAIDNHIGLYGTSKTYPSELNIRGKGQLATRGTFVAYENLCELDVSYDAGDIIVTVRTHSDAWLPFDLSAAPQQALSDANRPRLVSALHDLATLFGNEPDPGLPTKYAAVSPFNLENARDDLDGEVIATRDW